MLLLLKRKDMIMLMKRKDLMLLMESRKERKRRGRLGRHPEFIDQHIPG